MKKRILGVLVTDANISLVFDGVPYTVSKTSPNFEPLKEKLLFGDYTDDEIEEYLSVRHMVKAALSQFPDTDLYIDTDKQEIYYKKTIRLPDTLEKKLLYGLNQGHSITAFIAFVDNLMQNPSQVAINELYLFLEAGNMPLTEDGHFLAYKKIRANYTDSYSGKMDNSIGAKPSMPRAKCDDNRYRTCSDGLHFCSWEYLDTMTGQRIVILKINPRDVVSIPADYGDTKGRACTYEIIGEIKDWSGKVLEGKSEKEVKPVLEKPDAKLNSLEVRVNGGPTFMSPESPYSWIKEGMDVMYGNKRIRVLTNPFRKTKKPWMVEYAETSTKIVKVRCSELREIKRG